VDVPKLFENESLNNLLPRRFLADEGEQELVGLGTDLADRGHVDGRLIDHWALVLADPAANA
jgi:hypothetical protein